MTRAVGRTVLLVAALNLAYFGVEFAAALRIGSVSLLADSVDFLEDTWVCNTKSSEDRRQRFTEAEIVGVPATRTSAIGAPNGIGATAPA